MFAKDHPTRARAMVLRHQGLSSGALKGELYNMYASTCIYKLQISVDWYDTALGNMNSHRLCFWMSRKERYNWSYWKFDRSLLGFFTIPPKLDSNLGNHRLRMARRLSAVCAASSRRERDLLWRLIKFSSKLDPMRSFGVLSAYDGWLQQGRCVQIMHLKLSGVSQLALTKLWICTRSEHGKRLVCLALFFDPSVSNLTQVDTAWTPHGSHHLGFEDKFFGAWLEFTNRKQQFCSEDMAWIFFIVIVNKIKWNQGPVLHAKTFAYMFSIDPMKDAWYLSYARIYDKHVRIYGFYGLVAKS